MCDPMTLAIAGTAVAATGAAVSGVMASKASRYQANIAEANAKAESAKAADAIDRGVEDQQALGRKYSAMRGQQRASIAANGIDADYGSAGNTQDDTAMFYREDAATLARNTDNEVKGIDMSAANFSGQAKASRMAGTAALIGAGFDVAGTVLGGVGKAGKINASRKAGGSGWG